VEMRRVWWSRGWGFLDVYAVLGYVHALCTLLSLGLAFFLFGIVITRKCGVTNTGLIMYST